VPVRVRAACALRCRKNSGRARAAFSEPPYARSSASPPGGRTHQGGADVESVNHFAEAVKHFQAAPGLPDAQVVATIGVGPRNGIPQGPVRPPTRRSETG
jgi:hypothetical protein